MNLISVIIILIVLLYVVLGFKRGVIRSGVQLIGTIAVLVIAFSLKGLLANFLMKILPFFNFGGVFEGITSINILIYELISFVVIFVILYCILNILLTLSGLIEKILKMTIILAIPSKILGALLGLVEGVIMAFLISFILVHIPVTEKMVMESKIAIVVLERTPIIGTIAARTTLAIEDINNLLNDLDKNANREEANFKVLHTLIYYKVISEEDAQTLLDNGKIKLGTNTVL